MTRTELMNLAQELYKTAETERQVANCRAWIYETRNPMLYLIKSYGTIVGVYSSRTGSCYVFDYYSTTTYHHIYKACEFLEADRIVWLYRRSDRILETAVSPYANTYKGSYAQLDARELEDWRLSIERKVFGEA